MISVPRWFKRVLVAVPVTLLIFVLLLGGLTLTHTGLVAVLWAAQKFVPSLSVGSSEGRLLTGFTLYDLAYQDEAQTTDLKVKEVGFHIGPGCLLERSICIDDLNLNGVDFRLTEVPASTEEVEEEEDSTSSRIFIPLPISISNVNINDISLDILDNQASWKVFHTGMYLQGSKLTIEPTTWQDILVKLADPTDVDETDIEEAKQEAETGVETNQETQVANSDADSQETLDVKQEVTDEAVETSQEVAQATKEEAQERIEAEVPLSEKPDIELPEIVLPLDIELKPFVIENFTLEGETPVEVNRLSLAANIENQNVEISEFKILMPQGDLDLTAKVGLEDEFPLDVKAKLNVEDPMAPGQSLDLALSGSVENLAANLALDGPAKAKLEANLQPLKAILPFDIALTNVDVSWPLVGDAEYDLDVPSLTAKGNLEGYEFNLDAAAKGLTIPDIALNLDAKGDLEKIDLTQLVINTLGGSINGKLNATWAPGITWNTELAIKNIQPNKQWPDIQGDISADIKTSGNLTDKGGWAIKLPQLKLDGSIMNNPIAIDASLDASDSDADGLFFVKTPGVKISHGVNHVSLVGKLNKNWDMNLDVNAPDLAKSVPGLKGKSVGTLKLTGPQNTPKIDTDLNVSGIDWQGQTKVESVALKGSIKPLPVPDGDLDLVVRNIQSGTQKIDSVILDLKGGSESHQVQLDVKSADINSHLKLTGSLDQKPSMKWSGSLADAWVQLGKSRWAIDHPVKLGYDVDKASAFVQAHCWQQNPSKICITKDVNAGESGEANLAIQNFKFSKISQLIPPDFRLRGEVNATAQAKWSPKAAPAVKVNVDLPEGLARQRGAQGVKLAWDKIQLAANLANNKLDVSWLLDFSNNGNIQGQASIPDVRQENMSISGTNKITPISFDFLKPAIGDGNNIQAKLQSDVSFSGPIMQPKVNGKLDILDIDLEGRAFPLDIDNSSLQLLFNGYSAQLSSDLMTQDGKLALTGDANWAQLENWRLNLGILADKLYVEVPPMVKLRTDTDLKINVTPQAAKISGTVGVPYARIKVAQLPASAVGTSSDEVILDENLKPVVEDEGLPMLMDLAIAVSIGDDVHVSAFGLETNLEGNLRVSQKNKGPFVLGDIEMIDGTYKSFGQDLQITEGKITMNGPVDQPYVSIKAIRNPDSTEDDVIAGIQVTGPASEPKAEVFSEPSMSQTNALSYLLRGRGVDDDSGGSSMTTALLGLTLAQGNQAVGSVGEKVGIEDMQLGTAGTGDDAQVTVSGYIAPGLQVMYGMGIFDAVGEFTVRYELFKDFYVQAVTGVDSAVDALYQFEFDDWW